MTCTGLRLWCLFLVHCYVLLAVHAQTQDQKDNLRKVGCQLASVYQQPNASASFPIPAVDITRVKQPGTKEKVTLSVSNSSSWTFTNVLGQSQDVYAPDRHEILEQAMFLDTSATINSSSVPTDAGLSGCAFFFSLSSKDLGKDDDGSCTTVFDQNCVTDFTKKANEVSMMASNGTYGDANNATNACGRIADALTDLPGACLKFGSKKSLGTGLIGFSPLDYSPPNPPRNYKCSNTDFALNNDSVPSNIFVQSSAMQNTTNYTLYDQWSRTVTPILLTYFSNKTSDTVETQPFSASHLICSSPKRVQGGSRITPPTGAAESIFGSFDVGQLVVGALMMNAVVFWLF